MSDRKRPSRKDRAQRILRRFPFTDLAIAVTRTGSNRRAVLRQFVKGRPPASYQSTRDAAQLVYGVKQPVLEPTIAEWEEIEAFVRRAAKPSDVERNLDASKSLLDLVRPQSYRAFYHEPQVLRVRLLHRVSFGLSFYCLDGDRLIFQYPQPRKRYLTDDTVAVMLSLLHHSYVVGDFAQAEVEMADLGLGQGADERAPRIRPLARSDVLSLDELRPEIEDVYGVLQELAEEDDAGPGGPGDLGL